MPVLRRRRSRSCAACASGSTGACASPFATCRCRPSRRRQRRAGRRGGRRAGRLLADVRRALRRARAPVDRRPRRPRRGDRARRRARAPRGARRRVTPSASRATSAARAPRASPARRRSSSTACCTRAASTRARSSRRSARSGRRPARRSASVAARDELHHQAAVEHHERRPMIEQQRRERVDRRLPVGERVEVLALGRRAPGRGPRAGSRRTRSSSAPASGRRSASSRSVPGIAFQPARDVGRRQQRLGEPGVRLRSAATTSLARHAQRLAQVGEQPRDLPGDLASAGSRSSSAVVCGARRRSARRTSSVLRPVRCATKRYSRGASRAAPPSGVMSGSPNAIASWIVSTPFAAPRTRSSVKTGSKSVIVSCAPPSRGKYCAADDDREQQDAGGDDDAPRQLARRPPCAAAPDAEHAERQQAGADDEQQERDVADAARAGEALEVVLAGRPSAGRGRRAGTCAGPAPCAPACRRAAASARRCRARRTSRRRCSTAPSATARCAGSRAPGSPRAPPRACPMSRRRGRPSAAGSRRRRRRAAARAVSASVCGASRRRILRTCSVDRPSLRSQVADRAARTSCAAAAAPRQQRIDDVDVLREREHARPRPVDARVGEGRLGRVDHPLARRRAAGSACSANTSATTTSPTSATPNHAREAPVDSQSFMRTVATSPGSTAADDESASTKRATLHGRRPGCDERELLARASGA